MEGLNCAALKAAEKKENNLSNIHFPSFVSLGNFQRDQGEKKGSRVFVKKKKPYIGALQEVPLSEKSS